MQTRRQHRSLLPWTPRSRTVEYGPETASFCWALEVDSLGRVD